MSHDRVYLILLSGQLEEATRFVAARYDGCECVPLPTRKLREGGWQGQIRALRKLKGKALVFFCKSLADWPEQQLVLWLSVLHRCRETILVDSSGCILVGTRWALIRGLPRAVASVLSDLFVFVIAWCVIRMLRTTRRSISADWQPQGLDLFYLYPYPLNFPLAGGAVSHVTGFLGGLSSCRAHCEIFSGTTLPPNEFSVHLVPAKRRLFFFRESKLLSYNVRFVVTVWRRLRGRRAGFLYQRHGRFVFAGALLSLFLGLPLVLEYNGSEDWFADHWDPARFRSWLRLCEQVSIERSHLIVVVSEALRQELLRRGVPGEKILLNPNGVDPVVFQPGRGGQETREQLGLCPSDIVVCFVGTFHYFHGIKVLEQAIQRLLHDETNEMIVKSLRFLLVGDGILRAEMRAYIKPHAANKVFFTGLIPHSSIPAYLDAADILVSPHVPMPDEKPFIGSPTKLFEYMAMGKGIIASNMDQLSSVLKHGSTAWLVEPGNVSELVSAIVLLAQNAALRNRLGENARASALANHTWQQNAQRVLARMSVADSRELETGSVSTRIA
jgi:glycosyltransferase involved in cell wall biosynthesis